MIWGIYARIGQLIIVSSGWVDPGSMRTKVLPTICPYAYEEGGKKKINNAFFSNIAAICSNPSGLHDKWILRRYAVSASRLVHLCSLADIDCAGLLLLAWFLHGS
jgi:hypothetical protein